jgi:hypothetical protein
LFNRNVTAPYKAALGWEFVEKYAGKEKSEKIINAWLQQAARQYTGTDEWLYLFEKHTGNELSFLFEDYYTTAKKIDYKVRIRNKDKDSIRLKIKNKTRFIAPVSIETAKTSEKQSVFVPPFDDDTLVSLQNHIAFATVNATNPLPEIREKDNFVPLTGRPVKIRFFQDLEDPHSIQLFFNPDFDYNYYDGIILGIGLNNKSFFDKSFVWEVIPDYGLKSNYLGGFASFKLKKHFVRPKLHGISVGGYINSYHYAPQKTYRSYSVFATLSHKNRKEKFFKENNLTLEFLGVDKQTDTPGLTSSYQVLMLRNQYRSRGLLNQTVWTASAEWHRHFVKLQTDFRIRAFVDKFRQIEWRVFAGWMPVNTTGTDYFSFALSRPVDYLFKYNYYGRSETSGIFHQQYVYAEGAFKVFYDDQYADRWMLANNVYIGIWKRFNLFADFGWMQSYGKPVRFHYDAGIRYYLVPDFVEFYFPFYYDGNFIKPGKHYLSRIRIMFVFDLPGLFKMFTRSWY